MEKKLLDAVLKMLICKFRKTKYIILKISNRIGLFGCLWRWLDGSEAATFLWLQKWHYTIGILLSDSRI